MLDACKNRDKPHVLHKFQFILVKSNPTLACPIKPSQDTQAKLNRQPVMFGACFSQVIHVTFDRRTFDHHVTFDKWKKEMQKKFSTNDPTLVSHFRKLWVSLSYLLIAIFNPSAFSFSVDSGTLSCVVASWSPVSDFIGYNIQSFLQLNKCETDLYFLQNFPYTTMFISAFWRFVNWTLNMKLFLFWFLQILKVI